MADDQGFESWQNIYRVRKYFYENNFYRTSWQLSQGWIIRSWLRW
jgi:hypothetical protein